jgi:hypothetical protein
MAINWTEIARERYALYLAQAYATDPTGTLDITNYILDPTGYVGSKIENFLHSTITLDPATKDLSPVLSNGNLTVSCPAGGGTVGTTGTGWTAGKLYLEATITTLGPDIISIGVGEADAFRHIPGNGDSLSAGWRSNGVTPAGGMPTYTTGDVIGMAVRMDAPTASSLARVYWSKNGTWAIENPASTDGFNVSPFTALGTPIWPLFFVGPGAQITVNYGAAAFAHAPPTGYEAWTNSATAGVIGASQSLPGLKHSQHFHLIGSLGQTATSTHPDNLAVAQTLPAEQQTAAVSVI